MDAPGNRLFSPARLVKDLLLVGPALIFWTWVVGPHVPLNEPGWHLVGSVFTGLSLTSVTWMAYHMLRIVREHEKAKKAERS